MRGCRSRLKSWLQFYVRCKCFCVICWLLGARVGMTFLIVFQIYGGFNFLQGYHILSVIVVVVQCYMIVLRCVLTLFEVGDYQTISSFVRDYLNTQRGIFLIIMYN